MKRLVAIFGIVGILNACAAQTPQSPQAIEQATNSTKSTASNSKTTSQTDKSSQIANSDNSATKLPKLVSDKDELPSQQFDFHIRNIVTAGDTVKFQSRKYDFVFDKNSSNFSVQPGSLPKNFVSQPEKHQKALGGELNLPSRYETIEHKGKTYQYRVSREGNSETPDCQKEAKVVITLITPENKQPKTQTLYTGGCLSFPYITAAKIVGDRLWWSLAFPQGEGYTGKTTLVGYQPQQQKWTVIHPQGMDRQEILDFEIAGTRDHPTFWMATKISGEGNNYSPGMGLVAYRPDSSDLQSGSVTSYRVDNSPLIGVIPDRLLLESDRLWVGTGNGVCQLQLSVPDNPDWKCWRFAITAQLPTEKVPLYSALLNDTPAATLDTTAGKTVEVLWWLPTDYTSNDQPLPRRKGRYEVRYETGFTVTLDGQGATSWSEIFGSSEKPPVWFSPVSWPGNDWHWDGSRFVRGFDEVCECHSGGGPRGIGSIERNPSGGINLNAMRGDLDLVNLSKNSTSVKYYSGWVDEASINPYPRVVPQYPKNAQPNPLESIAKQL
ncbi:hypothetical protein [Coleofasciculus sp. FACHB-SPT9]|uniref:hypothetical protein n=1 Tax=Cyanophyceae TaxID=3028117 RepID=UPI001688F61F|nr:hypothetical protein [Coleofasciculus sp. FACHB-SPT9]MBD1890672.1 hypothetical protein [Coleofasciculus sp. FACHB-SPT9]